MNNKIENVKVPVEQSINMNDRDCLNDLLSTAKAFTHILSIAMTEASNHKLNQEIHKMFDEAEKNQRMLFDLMFKNGWYSLEKVDAMKLQESLTKLNQELSELSQ